MLIMLLTLGVGQMWATTYDNYDYVYMRGLDGTWNSDAAQWQLTNDDNNHYYGTFFVTSGDEHWFRISIGKSGSWAQTIYPTDGYYFTPSATQCTKDFYNTDASAMKITTDLSSSTGYKKLQVDWWGTYDSKSSLKIIQSAVSNLSASLSADATSVQGGSTTTVRGGCSGGSGSYGYSYTVTCGGSDVTATVLSGSGENRTFTAPMASTSKTYRVTVTATEQNSQLTGLGFTSSNSKYVDITVPGITAPTVTMTVDKVNVNQITLTGTINAYNGYGSNASDLSEVGFYIGETEYTATYKSGNTFKKTITGLTANTAYANVKAFATNPLATGNSSTTTVTTLADANYEVKVRVAHGANAPKVYAWTDADSYGGSKMENGTYGSQAASEDKFEATTYDWYTYVLNNKYENFLIYETGDVDKSGDFAATRTSDCYWYNKSGSPRAAKMVCPEFEPQLVLNDGSTETLYEMTGSGPVSKSLSLAAGNYTIKVMYNTEYYGKISSSIARTGSTTSNSISSMVVDGAYITLTADLAGTYTFSFNTSSKTLSVTYPTAYVVTYSAVLLSGSGDYKSADPSAEAEGDIDVTSTDYVLAGKDVTFTAEAANTGYTFHGWYSTNTPTIGTTTPLSSDEDDDTNKFTYTADDISGAVTVYAIYTEDMHTVSVVANDGYGNDKGGAVSTSTVTAGISTVSASITATPTNAAWRFKHWVIAEGISAAGGATTTTNPITINATDDGITLIAYFEPRYGLVGSLDKTGDPTYGMPGWDDQGADFVIDNSKFEGLGEGDGKGVDMQCTRTLRPDTTYKFEIKDREKKINVGPSVHRSTMEASDHWYLNYQDRDVLINTAGYGTYTFKITNISDDGYYWPKVKVDRPASYEITIGQLSSYNEGASSDATTTGGNVTAKTTENDPETSTPTDYAITTGQYIRSGGTAVFTAHPETGYSFAGWYSDASCTIELDDDEDAVDLTYTKTNLGGALAVYAKFTENMATVTLNTTGSGNVQIYKNSAWSDVDGTVKVGVHTNYSIKAVPASGYYVSGWTVSDGADCNVASTAGRDDNEAQSTTLRGLGSGTTGTVIANFTENEKIYFRNIFDDGETVTHWSNVYVYFDYTWDGTKVKTSTNSAYIASMTQIGASDVYWAYVPRAFTSSNGKKVAFSDTEFITNYTFYNVTASGSKGSARGDYSRSLNMFVPYHVKNKTNDNGVDYFDNGYWMKYDTHANQGAGYYLKKYKSQNNYWQPGEFIATNDDATFIQFRMRVDNTTADSTRFMIVSAGGLNYLAASTPTSISYSDIDLNEDTRDIAENTVYFQMTATSEGDYTFIIDQSGDKMKLTVDYPVSPGDYRLKHTYTRDEVTHTTYSDIIKSSKASTAMTHSMYLSTDGEATLVLQECERIDGTTKQPVWSAGYDDNLSGVLTAVGSKHGVYQFDITVNTSTDKVSAVTNIGKYTGDYYIKTDCAPGGWVNYKRNVMGINTINASDFDRYFCKNVANQTNVKFVIANDYNIAITDTIIQDLTYLTNAGGGTSKEYMPESSCIRFSYNSATNEAKRAYLRYSNNSNFLNIIPRATGKVYDAASAGNDLYGTDGSATATNKFGNDDGNFVYRKTVYAVSGATIDVKAEYNSNTQEFVSGKTLITSNQASTRYPVRVVYDFKTNHLTMAWEATTGLTDELSDIEFIYIRNGQDAANQVSLGTGGAISGSKVCGVFQFDYNDYVGKVGAWPQQAEQDAGYTYSKCMFYFSFPFDVNVSDIFGLGTYGKEWKLQYYDGAERASKGFFRGDGTTTFWKDVPANGKLDKNVGYSLLLDNDYFNTTATGMVFEGKSSGASAFLYFPSTGTVSVASGATSIDVPEHECTLTQYWTEGDKTLYHSNTDSHWNMMGVPLFQSYTDDYSATFKSVYDAEKPFGYLYKWTPSTNSLDIANTSNFTFQSMNAYMVQYTGTVNFTGSHVAASVAARHKKEGMNYTIDLEVLNSDDEHINRTYVELREGASDDFELKEDVYMTLNGKNVNVYSYAGDYDVAANVLSVANHIVPVGVVVKAKGTYKFSMPSNFSGTVTLVDKFAQTRTILNIDDYEVTLNTGTINDRFELEINIFNAPTAIDGVEGGSLKDGKAHKYIENGVMYILENGRIFDARGNRVK